MSTTHTGYSLKFVKHIQSHTSLPFTPRSFLSSAASVTDEAKLRLIYIGWRNPVSTSNLDMLEAYQDCIVQMLKDFLHNLRQ